MKKAVLYMHSGSYNSGCEAIVRTTCGLLAQPGRRITLYSGRAHEDRERGIDALCEVRPNRALPFARLLGAGSLTLLRDALKFQIAHGRYIRDQELVLAADADTVAFSIGGDNYFYPGFPAELAVLNRELHRRGARTVLWGCSVDPELMDAAVVADLRRYDLITARESITHQALLERGVDRNTQLFPDPAFSLERVEAPLPPGFAAGGTVGINMSPLIIRHEAAPNMAYANYSRLIRHILADTDMQVALIPHVIWDFNNDLEPLGALYEEYRDSGRVLLLGGQYNCMETKGFIARCRMFVGARTHATIAAYSTGVPTLVAGYSVKARGIARDIFGQEEHMVLPVQSLTQENDLVKAFRYIQENEAALRRHLREFMPGYCARCAGAAAEAEKL